MDGGEQIFCWSRDLDGALTWVGNFLISYHKRVEEKCYVPPDHRIRFLLLLRQVIVNWVAWNSTDMWSCSAERQKSKIGLHSPASGCQPSRSSWRLWGDLPQPSQVSRDCPQFWAPQISSPLCACLPLVKTLQDSPGKSRTPISGSSTSVKSLLPWKAAQSLRAGIGMFSGPWAIILPSTGTNQATSILLFKMNSEMFHISLFF